MIDLKQLKQALEIVEQEKKISKEKLLKVVEMALAAAYKKEYGNKEQNIRCLLDLETGKMDFVQVKLVVDESNCWFPKTEDEKKPEGDERPRFNEEKHLLLPEARLIKRDAEVGNEIIFSLEQRDDFGRIAAQTAKQVLMQQLRQSEKESLSEEFGNKEGTILVGTIQRTERGNVFVDLGRATAVLLPEEQIKGEQYIPGEQIRAYLFASDENDRGLSLKLSRTHPKFLVELFKMECPEIAEGLVEIKSVAREAGRSKIAVVSHDDSIDPIGTCVGQRGSRVNTITKELKGEKIDIVLWSDNPVEFIAESLSPAEIENIQLDEETKTALVTVLPSQYSLAIGKKGQNVRLAARLTGWKIDVKQVGDEKDDETTVPEEVVMEEPADTQNGQSHSEKN